jgi:DNA-binding NtrC family response regulator
MHQYKEQMPRDTRPGEETTLGANSTAAEIPGQSSPSGGLCLHVILEKSVTTYPLPGAGSILIGRSSEAEVRVSDPSVSRRHAIIHAGTRLELEDLGSANGVAIGGTKLEPKGRAPIEVGSVISLGSVLAVVQRTGSAPRPRRVWSHGHFEGRVEDECARAERLGSSFAVLRVRVGDSARAEEVISASLRPGDVLATYGPGEFEALLTDAQPDEAVRMASAAASALRRAGIEVRAGVVCFPRDGRTPDDLLAKAAEAIRASLPESARGQRPILGSALRQLEGVIARVARGNINVIVTGETGVGKELVAELVHSASPRATKPLVRLNCASFSETLLASELFGHERGAFTGADRAKPGLLETADGGTVFLDEIGELPMSIQPKLLRVLEEKVVTRVGGLKGRPIDVRFVAATNRDLEMEVAQGRFRRDLYFRLSGFQLRIDPLRERRDDILPIAQEFLKHAAAVAGVTPVPRLAPETVECLVGYTWPGNVRELRNVIDRAVLLCTDGVITPEHLPTDKMRQRVALFTPAASPDGQGADPLIAALAEREKQSFVDALARCGGNQTQAARLLGVSRGTFLTRMNAYGIARPRKSRGD